MVVINHPKIQLFAKYSNKNIYSEASIWCKQQTWLKKSGLNIKKVHVCKKVPPKSSSLLLRTVKLIIREKTSTLFNTKWKWNSGGKKRRLKMFVCRSPLHQASFCLCVPHLHGKHLIKHVHQHPTIGEKRKNWISTCNRNQARHVAIELFVKSKQIKVD